MSGKWFSFLSVSETNHLNTVDDRGVPVHIFPKQRHTVLVLLTTITMSVDSPIGWYRRRYTDVYSHYPCARLRRPINDYRLY